MCISKIEMQQQILWSSWYFGKKEIDTLFEHLVMIATNVSYSE